MSDTVRLPAGTTVYSCPLEACEWTYAEPPMTTAEIAATMGEDPSAVLLRHVMPAEVAARGHMEAHDLIEWVQEIGRLQRAEADAVRVVAILLRKLGGTAVISEAELAHERGTLVRSPTLAGFTLALGTDLR